MGQKINPISLRLQVNRTWESRWFANKRDYAPLLHEDIRIRKYIKDKYAQAGISKIVVERPAKKPCITIFASKPGIIIGKKGGDIETLRQKLNQITNSDVVLNIVEIRKPELDATLTAESIAQQIERRVSYKKAMKKAIQNAMRMGAEGIRILCAGRLGGAEIARSEEYREGRVPLHTIRADVDYAEGSAHTTFGVCGIKVWIFKGEVLEHDPMAHEKKITQR